MLGKRIIPCLDVKNGRVVKGVNFVGLRDAGDPVEIAKYYNNSLADELVFLDITATSDERETIYDVIKNTAKEVFIPLTVGGGIRTIDDIRKCLNAGADKVSINSSAITNPNFIKEASEIFGSQCIVLAIDVKYNEELEIYEVYTHGGRKNTKLEAISWAKEGVRLGAGEILLTSMDKDGTKDGYDEVITKLIVDNVNVPVIASGGAGKKEDFLTAFKNTNCDACLAASLFHFKELDIKELKDYLAINGVSVRRNK